MHHCSPRYCCHPVKTHSLCSDAVKLCEFSLKVSLLTSKVPKLQLLSVSRSERASGEEAATLPGPSGPVQPAPTALRGSQDVISFRGNWRQRAEDKHVDVLSDLQ